MKISYFKKKKFYKSDVYIANKDFYTYIENYIKGFDKMLDVNNKLSNKEVERVFILTNSVYTKLYDSLKRVYYDSLTSPEEMKTYIDNNKEEYTELNNMFKKDKSENILNSTIALIVYYSNVKNFYSLKKGDIKKISDMFANKSVNFINDINKLYINNIKFNPEFKENKRIIEDTKKEMKDYPFSLETFINTKNFTKDLELYSNKIKELTNKAEKFYATT